MSAVAAPLRVLAGLLLVAACVGLVVAGQARSGWVPLAVMLLGLVGLLGLLWTYNRGHR